MHYIKTTNKKQLTLNLLPYAKRGLCAHLEASLKNSKHRIGYKRKTKRRKNKSKKSNNKLLLIWHYMKTINKTQLTTSLLLYAKRDLCTRQKAYLQSFEHLFGYKRKRKKNEANLLILVSI